MKTRTHSKSCAHCDYPLAAEQSLCPECGTEWSRALSPPPDVQRLPDFLSCRVTASSCELRAVIPWWLRLGMLFILGSLTCGMLLLFGRYSNFRFPISWPILIPVGFAIAWGVLALGELAMMHTPFRVNRDHFQYGRTMFPRVRGEQVTLRTTPPVRVEGLEANQRVPLIMLVHSTHGDLCPLYRPFGIHRSDRVAVDKLNAFLRATESA